MIELVVVVSFQESEIGVVSLVLAHLVDVTLKSVRDHLVRVVKSEYSLLGKHLVKLQILELTLVALFEVAVDCHELVEGLRATLLL